MNLDSFVKQPLNIEKNIDVYLAFLSMTRTGFTSRLYNTKIPPFRFCMCNYRDGKGDWITLVEDQNRIGSFVIKEFLRNPATIINLRARWEKNYQLMMKRYSFYYDYDLSKLSEKQLIIWQKKFINFYEFKVSMPGFIDGYVFYAERRLSGLLQDFCKKNRISDFAGIFSPLTASADFSFINREESELKKIVIKLRRVGFNTDDKLADWLKKSENKKFNELINKHLKKYSWIKSSYRGWKEYTLENLEESIKHILVDIKAPESIVAIKKRKLALFKRYKFTPEIIAIARLTEIFVKWQDERKEFTLTFATLYDRFLREVAKRAGVDFNLLINSTSKDVVSLLSHKSNHNIIRQLKIRQNGCLYLVSRGKILRVMTAKKEVRKILDKIYKKSESKISEFKGMPASLGFARGRVKLVLSSSDNHKINSGDVMVTSMTRPEHLPAMKKAKAIITDDGGITCHAAIIARELGVPCIIGTIIATDVLKDGDLVEVNANIGLVKIIKRYE